ncbi:podocalyxin-like protein 2 isoform X1 [Ornithorhynchus anatinus]|uniref:Podocalyxin like 2 n=2 Tax=Ornithorhynchus anatinus TaxID=9258 RepID=A0A6I8NU41_ORNAN|nr:podocalyxin-like protein 2 isoform X1 [Ornithorhynchus anatinus]
MGRLLRAALLLAWGSLGVCLVGSEEPSPEGLSSTSLMELLLPPRLELLDSGEPGEAFGLGAELEVPGSGFASEEEETEESRILQPPQYFWEDGGELNDSSLDLVPAADYSFPVSTPKMAPQGDESQAPELERPPMALPTGNLVEPAWRSPPEEDDEEGLLPVTEFGEVPQTVSRGGPSSTPTPTPTPITTTTSNLAGSVPRAPGEGREAPADQAASGLEAGSNVEPRLLPFSAAPPTVAMGPRGLGEGEGAGAEGTEPVPGVPEEAESPKGGVTEIPERLEATGRGGDGSRGEADGTINSIWTAIEQGEVPAVSPSQREFSLETKPSRDDPSIPNTSAAPRLAPSGMESIPPAATTEQDFALQPGEGQVAGEPTGTPWDSAQVTCKDWNHLAGKNYIILNMTENMDCEVFRQQRGSQLLALVEEVLPRQADGRPGDWHISLSKPNENEQHLLMTLVGEQGVVPTNEVLSVLGDIRRSLAEIGIQNYSSTTSCQSRPSQARSDYGKLFVVLVVIGSICVIIIILGLIYNCWQRRMPKLKNMSHGEELRFVENGCHDNPTLDVASDSQSEMQEKQPSLNGGGPVNGPAGWNALLSSKRDHEDSDVFEEDTHL